MKTIRQSVFCKITACILQQIFFVITSVAVFLGIIYWNFDDTSFNYFKENAFTKTSYYKGLMEDKIYSLLTYIDYCEKFQTEGVNDTSRIVDVYDYVQNNRISGEQTISIGYTIHDLMNWEERGFQYTQLPESSYAASTAHSSQTELVEPYSNTSGLTLFEYAQHTQTDYTLLCNTIEQAAEQLYMEYNDYRTISSSFKSSSTNLRYCVYNTDTNTLYTNMSVSSIEEGQNQITSLDSYVILDSSTADFNSNVFYSTDQLNHYLNTLYINEQNYIFGAGIDTDFPVLDQFHKENLRYNSYNRWFQLLYKSLFLSIAGYFLCFFYLSAACGHKKNTDTVSLTFFDRLKTELLFLLFAVGCGFFYGRLWEFTDNLSQLSMNPATIICLALFSLLASLWLSLCYYSFLRRMKAGVLWRNSLLYLLLSFLKKLFHSRLLAVRTCILYTGYVVVTLGVVYFSSQYILLVFLPISALFPGFFIVRDKLEKQRLLDGCKKISEGNLDFQIDTHSLHFENRILGETINQISRVLHDAVEDSLKNERLKTNLITNVSHDIKTPLTSIINYVALLKNIPLDNEQAASYLQILEDKSHRLKHLTEDLVEASKLSSGHISLELTQINLVELVKQTSGEFYEKFQEKNLTLITSFPEEPILIQADGRRVWRILENLYNNACKYSLSGSRVYASLEATANETIFSLKNVSSQPLSVNPENLTQRFVRGDMSRNTEGSGLGLSIAQDLTRLHGGRLDITVDGDLYTVQVILPM